MQSSNIEASTQPSSYRSNETIDRRSLYHKGLAPQQAVDHVTAMVEQRLDDGYDAYLLSFMFKQLSGSAAVVARTMEQAVVAAYANSLTRVIRNPNTAYNRARPLVWIGFPDYPVPKRGKQTLRDVSVNDGRHFHVLALIPPYSRMKHPYDELVRREPQWFCVEGVQRVHVEIIDRTVPRLVDYVAKTLSRGRISFEEVLFLPRSVDELSHPKRHPNHGRMGQVRRAPPA